MTGLIQSADSSNDQSRRSDNVAYLLFSNPTTALSDRLWNFLNTLGYFMAREPWCSCLKNQPSDLLGILFNSFSDRTDPPQLLIDGQVDMVTAWNGRIFDAQREGAPIAICWECGHVIAMDNWVIPLGSPNKELAQLFIAWASFPEINVQISKHISYGPVSNKAIECSLG
ncbi:MAG: extracellular solute-binding protein [Dehalococcoidia bacterium]